MSDRFWIIRPADRLRFVLNVCARGGTRAENGAELQRIDAEGATIGHEGLLLEIGQPVALSLGGGDTLKGSVAGCLDLTAEIRFEHSLPARTVRAIRLTHLTFLGNVPTLDLAAPRSVA
jgi:hypothetical protein